MGDSRNAEEFEHRCVLYWLLLSVAVQLPECNEASNQGTGAAEMQVMTYRSRAAMSRVLAHDGRRSSSACFVLASVLPAASSTARLPLSQMRIVYSKLMSE